jgi:hypothetical protein
VVFWLRCRVTVLVSNPSRNVKEKLENIASFRVVFKIETFRVLVKKCERDTGMNLPRPKMNFRDTFRMKYLSLERQRVPIIG